MDVIGADYVMGNERIALYGKDMDNPMLAICIPYDEQLPSAGNGTMVAIRAGSRAACDAMYKKTLALGATCEWPTRQADARRVLRRLREGSRWQ